MESAPIPVGKVVTGNPLDIELPLHGELLNRGLARPSLPNGFPAIDDLAAF
jgi:hypothetical protein